VGVGAYPSPLRTFPDQLDELRSGGVPDMDTVGRPSPYSLILLGDDMLLFEPEEYDPSAGHGERRPRRSGPVAPLMALGRVRRDDHQRELDDDETNHAEGLHPGGRIRGRSPAAGR